MEIEKTLKDYVSDIISVVELMKIEGHRRNPEQSWQQALYKTGTIKEHDLEYDFHGIGCWVKWKDRVIDFDFRGDVGNTIFGIDRWFAAYYLRSLRLSGYEDLNFCQEQISNVIHQLNDKGLLIKRENVFFYREDYERLIELENETGA
jgi:hypothetical protein